MNAFTRDFGYGEYLVKYLPALEAGQWSSSSVAAVMAQIFEEHDTETAHYVGDLLMCLVLERFGYGDAAKAFWAGEKWYA